MKRLVSQEFLRLNWIKENGPINQRDLAKKFDLSSTGTSDWIKKMIGEGILVRCHKNGRIFSDDRTLQRAKYSGKSFLKLSECYKTTELPTIKDSEVRTSRQKTTQAFIKPSVHVCPVCSGKGLIEPTNPAYRGSYSGKRHVECHSCHSRGVIIVK